MLERSIFMKALDCQTLAERSALLDEACAHDPALRQRVEALLRSHASAGSFLGLPVPERLAEQLELAPATEGTQPPQSDEGDEQTLEFLAPSNSPGSVGMLGHYEVQEVIGRGGMGIVLRAFDERLHRVVAIKVMATQLATSATARKRFIREARAAAAISHDHIVTIHAVEEAGGLPYIVMYYVAGQSLQQKIDREGHLELREILRIGQQIATGLAAAHAHGLMHRDVKPANILLENGVERVRITDFGLARAVDDVGMTRTGEVAGTPQYMSPEQAQGLPMDARSDLFSLGCVLYAMCTGRSPFRAETTFATVRRVCEDKPRPIREVNSEIPLWLVEIIDRLLAKQPAVRFQSAAEVSELLSGHLAEVQHPSTVGQSPAPVVKSSRRTAYGSRPLLWSAATVLLFAVLLLGLSEAGGVTKLTTSVIRVLTPHGTLIIEVDDPGVAVTVEGDGGLVIKGAGPREVRLPIGEYKVRATKDGQPVKEEVVSISRGGKQTVSVTLETPVAATAAGAPVNAPTSGGFAPLFNGKDLSGWDGDMRFWRVEDGAITGEITAENQLTRNTFLIWKGGTVKDFEIRAMFKLFADRPSGNSGIQFRSKLVPSPAWDPNQWVVAGYQVDIDRDNTYTGILFEEKTERYILAQRGQKVTIWSDGKKIETGRTGSPEELLGAIKVGEWNEYEITAIGNHIVQRINGKVMADVTDEQVDKRSMEGIVALQLYKGAAMKVQFKDIRLKEIKKAEAPTTK
jgi:serine/threonine protein kinase